MLANAVRTPAGDDFTMPFASFTGTYNFFTYAYAEMLIAGDQPAGASGGAYLDVQLTGIDQVDAQGNVITSASFNPDGTATLDANAITTTPEPASLALLATGLIGVFGAVRRKQR